MLCFDGMLPFQTAVLPSCPSCNRRAEDAYKNAIEHMNQELTTFVQEITDIAAQNTSSYSNFVANGRALSCSISNGRDQSRQMFVRSYQVLSLERLLLRNFSQLVH